MFQKKMFQKKTANAAQAVAKAQPVYGKGGDDQYSFLRTKLSTIIKKTNEEK